MAVTALNIIKNWFKTGLKPSQIQFWDTWDSFRHKSEAIPVADIEGIDDLLQSKASTSHLTDSNAHAALFAKTRIIGLGDFIVFKRGNETPDELEPTDLIIGIVENAFITGIYQGGDILLDNFNIINQIDF